MQKSLLRVITGLFIGGFAGLSLTTAVTPMVLSGLFNLYSIDIMLAVRGFGIPLAILLAIGGGIMGWTGGAVVGASVLGGCGAIAGFVLGAFAIGGDVSLILASTLTGLIYGGLGGLIIGKAFIKSVNESR